MSRRLNPNNPDGIGQPHDEFASESNLGGPPPLLPKMELPPLPDLDGEFPSLEAGPITSFRDDLSPLPEFGLTSKLPPSPNAEEPSGRPSLPPLPDLEAEIRRLDSLQDERAQTPIQPSRDLPPLPDLGEELRLLEVEERKKELPPLPDLDEELRKLETETGSSTLGPLPNLGDEIQRLEKPRALPSLPDLNEEIRRLEETKALPVVPDLSQDVRPSDEPKRLPPLPDLDEEIRRLEIPPKAESTPEEPPSVPARLLELDLPPTRERKMVESQRFDQSLSPAGETPPPVADKTPEARPKPSLDLQRTPPTPEPAQPKTPEPKPESVEEPPKPEAETISKTKPHRLAETMEIRTSQADQRDKYRATVEIRRPAPRPAEPDKPPAPTISSGQSSPTIEKRAPKKSSPERLKPDFAKPPPSHARTVEIRVPKTVEPPDPPRKKPFETQEMPAPPEPESDTEASDTIEPPPARPLRQQVPDRVVQEESPGELKSFLRDHFDALRKGSGPRASREELAILTRQMAAMIAAGIPVHSVLDFCVEDDSSLAPIIEDVANKVTSGVSLSHAMRGYPGVFDPVFVGLVQTAEISGQLSEVFIKLAELLERQVAMKKKVIASLTYPAILLLVATIGVTGFIYLVLPMLTPLFDSMEMELPLMTRMLLGTRKAIPITIATAMIWSIGLYLGRPLWKQELEERPRLRRFLHSIPLRMPVFGETFEKIVTARVLYSMAGMLDVGIGMAQALSRSEAAAGNEFVAHRLRMARGDLADGMTVYECLANHQVFPEAALQLIMVGEEAADLAKMFKYVADWFEEEVEHSLSMLTSLVEPLIMIVMGVVVGFISLSAAMPTIQLLSKLS